YSPGEVVQNISHPPCNDQGGRPDTAPLDLARGGKDGRPNLRGPSLALISAMMAVDRKTMAYSSGSRRRWLRWPRSAAAPLCGLGTTALLLTACGGSPLS